MKSQQPLQCESCEKVLSPAGKLQDENARDNLRRSQSGNAFFIPLNTLIF